ncbi:MAG: hypothetical protein ACOY5Y_17195 [Pseudomonadota bacterium]|jgi:hypothetical protein
MLAGVKQLLMSPVTGPIATAAAVVLAVALGVSSSLWRAERESLEARIVELRRDAERAEAGLRTELAACRAAEGARELDAAEVASRSAPPRGARQLLEQAPEGIDACARMESADRAVLSNLEK